MLYFRIYICYLVYQGVKGQLLVPLRFFKNMYCFLCFIRYNKFNRWKARVVPESKYSICGIKNGIPFFFLFGRKKMPDLDTPYSIEDQIDLMKRYVVFTKRIRMRRI